MWDRFKCKLGWHQWYKWDHDPTRWCIVCFKSQDYHIVAGKGRWYDAR